VVGQFETGSALAVDAARCDCGNGDPFGLIRSVILVVPRFTQFPAHFLAEVSTTLGPDPWLALLVVTRSSSAEPWRIEFSGGFIPASPLVGPQVGADGYVLPVESARRALAARQPAALAAYWQSWKDRGSAPEVSSSAIWRPGVMTDGFGRMTARTGRQGQINRQNGLVGRYRYQVDPRENTYVFPLETHELLVCAPVLRQVTWTSPDTTGRVSQPPSRANWDTSIAPGGYSAMLQDDIASPCIIVNFIGGIPSNDVVGIYPEHAVDVPVP
jgi:hypothetical protein